MSQHELIPLTDNASQTRSTRSACLIKSLLISIVVSAFICTGVLIALNHLNYNHMCDHGNRYLPVVIDPDIPVLLGFSEFTVIQMPNHNGYSIAKALNETSTYEITTNGDFIGFQITFASGGCRMLHNSISKDARGNNSNFSLHTSTPVTTSAPTPIPTFGHKCLFFNIFKEFGYCFTKYTAYKNSSAIFINVTIAWWREAEDLHMYALKT